MVTGWTKAASHDVELMRQSAGSTGAAGRPGPARRLLSSLRWMAGFRSLAAEWSSRSHSFTEFGVLPGFTGVAVHDRYSVYDNRAFAGVGGHLICCAHILRDLQDAAEVYPGQLWPEQASPPAEVDPGVVEVRVAVLRLDLAVWQARGVTHPSQGGGPPTMSASHSKELPGTVSELVGRRFRIVPGVGLVDRDVNDHAQLLERVTGKVGAELLAFAERMREGLLVASVGIGLEVLGELMTAEVVELAGPRGKHDPARDAYRHGVEDGSVTLGGRRVPVARPRVRSLAGEEVHLASYDTLTAVDLRTEHTVAAMLAGLSTRRYGAGLEPVGTEAQVSASATRSAEHIDLYRMTRPRKCPVMGG